MKSRKILCVLAALAMCVLSVPAAADGGSSYGAADISQIAMKPYDWEIEEYKGSPLGTNIGNLFDGKWSTWMWFGCHNTPALDKIPDITLYFSNVTIRDIWLRNGTQKDDYTNYARMRRVDVTIWSGDTVLATKKFDLLTDSVDTAERSANMYDGYQRLSFKQQYTDVTRVDLEIKAWYHGTKKQSQYQMLISDMLFLPDSLENIYGSGIFSYDYNYNYYTPTAVPSGPVVTAAPGQKGGIDVKTNQRLATCSGPGTQYNGTGSYFQAGKWVKALTAAYDNSNKIWWIQVELTYAGKLRRVYTGVKRLNMDALQVPVEEASYGETVVTVEEYGRYGPGYGYDVTDYKVPVNTIGEIWEIENGYVQFEYKDSKGTMRRTWIPMSSTTFDDAQG